MRRKKKFAIETFRLFERELKFHKSEQLIKNESFVILVFVLFFNTFVIRLLQTYYIVVTFFSLKSRNFSPIGKLFSEYFFLDFIWFLLTSYTWLEREKKPPKHRKWKTYTTEFVRSFFCTECVGIAFNYRRHHRRIQCKRKSYPGLCKRTIFLLTKKWRNHQE